MKALRKYWLQLLLSLCILVFFLGYAAHLWRPGAVERFDLFLYDSRVALTMPDTRDPRVVIVDIDEKSLAELGRWPWRRDVVAQLVDQLTARYKAAVVGFDIVFAEPDDSSGLRTLYQLANGPLKDNPAFQQTFQQLAPMLDYDRRLAAALARRPVVLGYYFNHDARGDKSGVLPPPVLPAGLFKGRNVSVQSATGYGANLAVLMQPGTLAGHFNPNADRDGVTRRVHLLTEYDGRYYEALSLAMVRTYLGQPTIEPVYEQSALKGYAPLEWLKVGPLRIPVDDTVSALVPYRGGQGSFAYVSAADVVAGRVAPEVIAGRMVLVGTTAPGLKDLRVTPVDPIYPGVEVHANMILGMMDGTMPAQPAYLQGGEMLQLVVVGVLLMVALARLNPLPATLVTALLLALTVAFNLLLWARYRLAMPLGSTVLMIVLLYGISMAYGYFFESRNKKQMASLFGQYVPPELVEKMSEEPEKYSMEGKSQELTVLFSDVRGFTTISESMDPKDLTRFMNEFLTALSDIIRTRYLGTIDKYMGDCVMAFWGAPIYDPDHARNAVLAGLDMLQAIRELGPQLKARGWPEIHIGVGVNTGRMTVGDMGSRIRKAYTVMGDAVNLASRLEGLTKQYGVGMLVGELTREAARDVVVFREIDRVRVKGKDEPVTIYEPIGRTTAVSTATRKALELFALALRHYRNQDWDLAELQLLNLQQLEPDCALYRVYLDRIARFRKAPPPVDWQGVFDFDSK